MIQRQWSQLEVTGHEWHKCRQRAEIEQPGMFVEVGTTLRIGRAADGYALTDTPAQMQQSLYVVRMKVRQHDGVEVAGRKTFM